MGSDNTPFNPKRSLCPNGACIGIIGRDGRCTVCQASDSNEEPAFLSEELVQDATPTPTVQSESDLLSQSVPPALNRRRLCEDGTCIGILNSEGVCGTCGRPSTHTLPEASENHT